MILGQAKKFTATTASLPAPIGGWNARDSLAEMSPLDAVQMVNFYPTPSDVTLRQGYTKSSTGIPSEVQSLMNYSSPTVQKLFAVNNNGDIYDASTSTATLAFPISLGNGKLQHSMITTAGGSFLAAVNGADPMVVYNGTQWVKSAATSTPQTITSITRGGTGNLTATLVTAVAHGLVTGNQITVTGATPAEFNGVYRITVTNSTTFTYTMATAPSGNATVVGSYAVNFYITGVNGDKLVNINLYRDRLFFVEENSLTFWYLPVDSINGALTSFNLGGIARSGGYLQAMGTWTIDAGYGVDDYAAFVTSQGEVIVYKGGNPSDPNDWSLIGVFQMGQTFSRRCFFKWAGDLLLLTQDGLVPMASALQSSRLNPKINITDKIYYAISQAADLYSTNFGWQINYFAKFNMLIINIPIGNGKFEQYVMHTITKSWARFTGINAVCFEVSGEDMYFGGNGFVGKYYNGFSDAGTNITATVQQAYSYFDSRGQQKRFTMVRPIFQIQGALPTVLCGLSTDFEVQDLSQTLSFNPALNQTGIWDIATWDNKKWGGTFISKEWQGVTGLGYAGSISLNTASQGLELHWASTDFVMEKGGVL
jgi:hypothetical protein